MLVETTGGVRYTAGDALRLLQDLNNTQQARFKAGANMLLKFIVMWLILLIKSC